MYELRRHLGLRTLEGRCDRRCSCLSCGVRASCCYHGDAHTCLTLFTHTRQHEWCGQACSLLVVLAPLSGEL